MLDQKKTDFAVGEFNLSYGQYLFSREKDLILNLVEPHAGERMLCIGNVVGNYLQIFRDNWCSVTGLTSSAEMLASVRKQMGDGIELHLSEAEDLPFSDDEFDIVAVVNILESSRNPQKVIAEAIRVCRGRVFIGFLNKYSFTGMREKVREIFGSANGEKERLFSIEDVKKMAGSFVDVKAIRWGSVIFFPAVVYSLTTGLEELVPRMKNPLGAFVGLTFPVKYIYRTAQRPLIKPYPLEANSRVGL